MTREDIDNIISIICPNDEDFEKPIISPAYLKKELEILALEQEPKTGHWIESNIPNEKYVCSECGGASWYYDYQANVAKSRYCPNCGCRMVEPQERREEE